jgi:hypothetical protein
LNNVFSNSKGGKGKGGSGSYSDSEPQRCTVKGTTDHPKYPWCPDDVGGEDEPDDKPSTGDDTSDGNQDEKTSQPQDAGCAAIADGKGPTDADSENYVIDMALKIDGDVTETLQRIEDFLQSTVAAQLAGCDPSHKPPVDGIVNVVFDVKEDTKSGTFCRFNLSSAHYLVL